MKEAHEGLTKLNQNLKPKAQKVENETTASPHQNKL